jgi:hypothetical protein
VQTAGPRPSKVSASSSESSAPIRGLGGVSAGCHRPKRNPPSRLFPPHPRSSGLSPIQATSGYTAANTFPGPTQHVTFRVHTRRRYLRGPQGSPPTWAAARLRTFSGPRGLVQLCISQHPGHIQSSRGLRRHKRKLISGECYPNPPTAVLSIATLDHYSALSPSSSPRRHES